MKITWFSHRLCSVLLGATVVLLPSSPGIAQSLIVPDDTLGEEQSIVLENFNGAPNEVITGGARRAENLFHSFEAFNVDEGRGAFFFGPDSVDRIFSRVTGSNPSNILGVLGVLGRADLYFMNPNGILFGPNSSLNVQGAFTATTADAIQFGEAGFFSATSPEAPSELLTVDPSAFLFNQIPAGNIAVQSTISASQTSLLGGNITIENGGIVVAVGGSLNLAGLAAPGVVERQPEGALLLPPGVGRSHVILSNGNVASINGGDIHIQSAEVLLDDGLIGTVVDDRSQPDTGNITIDTNRLTLRNSSTLGTVASDATNAGDITVRASDSVQILSGSTLGNTTTENSTGSGGDVVIDTGTLTLASEDSAENVGVSGTLSNIQFSSFGFGNSGNLTIRASESVNLNNGQIFGNTFAAGNAANITIETQRLRLANGGVIGTDSNTAEAEGNAGDIFIQASEAIEIIGGLNARGFFSEISSRSSIGSRGDGGDIVLETGRLTIRDGGQVATETLSASGNAGDLTVRATEVELIGSTTSNGTVATSDLSAGVSGSSPEVRGGTLTVETDRLILRDGGTISSSVRGASRSEPFRFGTAGDIFVRATDFIELDGTDGPRNLSGQILSSSISADIQSSAEGAGGQVSIDTGRLLLRNGAVITATTFGSGDAGKVTIRADEISLTGTDSLGVPSQISTGVGPMAQGDGGSIEITAQQIRLSDGGGIRTDTLGGGDAGTLFIQAHQISLVDAQIDTSVQPNAVGNGGALRIRTDDLHLSRGARIESATFSSGRAGDLTIDANSLRLQGGSAIAALTNGQGDAGEIRLRVSEAISLSNSSISSEVGERANGDGGDITIRAGEVMLRERSPISAQSLRTLAEPIPTSATNDIRGNAGNVLIVVDNILFIQDSDITTQANAFAGGAITIRAGDIRLIGDGDIQTSVQNGIAGGGDITLAADSIIAFDDSDILAFAADGRGGNINVDTARFFGEGFTFDSLDANPEGLDGNDRVDINATGAFSGTVTLPNVSFIQNSLAGLPTGLIDTDALIANSCIVRNPNGSSTLIITGPDGLPNRPIDLEPSTFSTGDVQTIPDDADEVDSGWQPGDPIIEPQGVYQLPDGELILSHECR
ncbi:MAG: filamentous hemagglutinin N-terminal domain-containing protein [Synechococcales bacterium]|nr:filamentous hemagglutinin N-terminal domain-containing protein [Synechococcales bacterium]